MANKNFLNFLTFDVTSANFTAIELPYAWAQRTFYLSLEQAPVGGNPVAAAGSMILGNKLVPDITQLRGPEIEIACGLEGNGLNKSGFIYVKPTSALDVLLKVSWV